MVRLHILCINLFHIQYMGVKAILTCISKLRVIKYNVSFLRYDVKIMTNSDRNRAIERLLGNAPKPKEKLREYFIRLV